MSAGFGLASGLGRGRFVLTRGVPEYPAALIDTWGRKPGGLDGSLGPGLLESHLSGGSRMADRSVEASDWARCALPSA